MSAGAVPTEGATVADPPRRYADLEGYRGAAALAIVVYHVFQNAEAGHATLFPDHGAATFLAVDGLDGFVDLFFVVSAFLLALPYARSALDGRASPSGRAFVARRAARIVPLYVVAMLVVWALRNPVLPGDLRDLLEHLTFTQVYDQQRIFYTIGPAWSVAVEVQFYVLLALVGAAACAACSRLAHRWRLPFLIAGCLLLAAGSVVWKVVAWYVLATPETAWPTWFGLPAKLDVFACGMLLAVAVARGVRISARAGTVLRVVAGLGLVTAFATRPQGALPQVWFHTLCAIAFTLLVAASVLVAPDQPGRWVRALGSRVPVFLGQISYSVYIWHEPLLLGMTAIGVLPPQDAANVLPVTLLVLLPISILVGWISYLLIERPGSALRVLVDRGGKPRNYYDGT